MRYPSEPPPPLVPVTVTVDVWVTFPPSESVAVTLTLYVPAFSSVEPAVAAFARVMVYEDAALATPRTSVVLRSRPST